MNHTAWRRPWFVTSVPLLWNLSTLVRRRGASPNATISYVHFSPSSYLSLSHNLITFRTGLDTLHPTPIIHFLHTRLLAFPQPCSKGQHKKARLLLQSLQQIRRASPITRFLGTSEAVFLLLWSSTGGPGSGHEYCLPFSKLCSRYGIHVVFYDQIGCAASTHLPQKAGDQSFWQVKLFVAELQNLFDCLQLNQGDGHGFHVQGHSFGGIIAAAFASRQPRRLRRLVLADASSDGQLPGHLGTKEAALPGSTTSD